MTAVIGWDVGGVNLKVARVASDADAIVARSHPFELQRDPAALMPLLRRAAMEIGATAGEPHAITMTAELSQLFRTKREGVAFVLDALLTAFPSADLQVYTVDGRFVNPVTARAEPIAVAASNWAATARAVALRHPEGILVDIGTTTTDVVPIADGELAAIGRTDPDRLASGELLYSGALRTPVEALTHTVRVRGESVGVSAEGFALAGDVHLWRGDLAAEDYTVATPDGRAATRELAGERLARVICGDRELLDEHDIHDIAASVAEAQADRTADCIRRVHARHPAIERAIVSGLGNFLAAAAARRAGLRVYQLADELGDAAARAAPASAVALLLARSASRTACS